MQSSDPNKENIGSVETGTTLQPVVSDEKSALGQTASTNSNELLWIGGNNNAKVDLRQNFERFKKQKVEQIKFRKYVAEHNQVNRKDPAVKEMLR